MSFWRSDAMDQIEDRLQLSFSYWEDQAGWPFVRPRVYKDENGNWINNFPEDRDFKKDAVQDIQRLYFCLEQIVSAYPEHLNGTFDYRIQEFAPFLPEWHDRVRAACKKVYENKPDFKTAEILTNLIAALGIAPKGHELEVLTK